LIDDNMDSQQIHGVGYTSCRILNFRQRLV